MSNVRLSVQEVESQSSSVPLRNAYLSPAILWQFLAANWLMECDTVCEFRAVDSCHLTRV
jgi:hypothetical protein